VKSFILYSAFSVSFISFGALAPANAGLKCVDITSRGRPLSFWSLDATKEAGFFLPPQPLKFNQIHHVFLGQKLKARPLILIHGINSTLETFRSLAEKLALKRPVLIYDQRSHGKTPDWGPGLSAEVLAQDLRVLVDHLGITEFDVIGHSGGGQVALKFSELYPHYVARLGLEDTSGLPYGHRNNQTLISTYRTIYFLRKIGRTFSADSDMVSAIRPLVGNDAESAARILRISSLPNQSNFLDPVHAAAIEEIYYDSKTRDFSESLKAHKGQILILIAGNRSKYLTDKHIEKIQQLHLDVSLQEISGAGHSIHVDQPKAWLNAVEAFFTPVQID
jgi:esterase